MTTSGIRSLGVGVVLNQKRGCLPFKEAEMFLNAYFQGTLEDSHKKCHSQLFNKTWLLKAFKNYPASSDCSATKSHRQSMYHTKDELVLQYSTEQDQANCVKGVRKIQTTILILSVPSGLLEHLSINIIHQSVIYPNILL